MRLSRPPALGNWLPLVAITILGIGCTAETRDGTSLEPGRDAQGLRGAVTAGHPLAAEAGLEVLRSGGNAMDAAITMAGVLAVARPHMNGVGGDMFLLYYDASTGRTYGLNGSGRAGTARTREELEAEGLEDMPMSGPLSVSVPGAVGAWAAALDRFGTMSWADALEPGVDLARRGLPVSETLVRDFTDAEAKLRRDPEATRIFLPDGAVPTVGDTLARTALAGTLERLQAHGPTELYGGETGRRVVEYLHEAGGLLTLEDLERYQPEWVEPIRAGYQGLEVLTLPPNTQGVTLLEELKLMSHFDMASLEHNSPYYLHTLAEILRIAFDDRDAHVADPDMMMTSVEWLLDDARLADLAETIDPAGSAYREVVVEGEDHPNTVYIIAVDEQGNVVSMIQSLFATFGSGLVVPDTGIVLQNRGALFTFEPEHPNRFEPGRRPFHTLCPVLALRDGVPWLAFGTPGGDGQTHTHIQVLNNVLAFGMTPQQAIDAPRLRRYDDGRLSIEDGVSSGVRDALATRGYQVRPVSGWTAEFGGAQAVLIDPETGAKRAGADRRREGWALAY